MRRRAPAGTDDVLDVRTWFQRKGRHADEEELLANSLMELQTRQSAINSPRCPETGSDRSSARRRGRSWACSM